MSKTKKIRNIIFIALMILINAFIIFEASLPGGLSSLHSGLFSDVMGDIINNNVEVDQSFIDVNNITLTNANGNNVIIGTTAKLNCKVEPSDATNKNITYVSEPEGVVNVVNSGLTCYVEAIGEVNEEVKIKAISHNNKVSELTLKIIDKIKPSDFSVTDTLTIPLHTSKHIDIDFSKTNDDIANFKALATYNPNLLNITSENENIAKISNGFIKAVGVGETKVKVEDKIINVSVTANDITPVLLNDDFKLSLDKDNVYDKDIDYIKDHFTELGSKVVISNTNKATDLNFAYESLTPLTCLVDHNGNIFGSKMPGKGKIKATSIANGISKILEFDVKEVKATDFDLLIHGKKELAVGQTFSISGSFKPYNFSNTDLIVTSSNSDVALVSPKGRLIRVTAVGVGSADINVKCATQPELSKTLTVNFIKKTAINDENKNAFESVVRKAVGHFSLFFVDGIITSLMFVFVLKDKKWFKNHRAGLISLGTGFGVAWLSEFVQIFAKRGPSISDIMLDFSGFLIASIIVIAIFMIIDKVKANKERKNNDEKI